MPNIVLDQCAGTRALLAILLGLGGPPCAAAGRVTGGDDSFESALPDSVLASAAHYLTLTFENDSLGSGSDRHYTNGARLTWFRPGLDAPPVGRQLMDWIAGADESAPALTYYSVGQNLYTPEDITRPTPDPKDQPYGAFLYTSVGHTRLSGDRADDLELTLGVIGPAAFGEQTQSFVHDLVDADEPRGWDHQLDHEPGLMASWQRRWPGSMHWQTAGLHLRAMPHAGVTVGNVYTYANLGLTLQLLPGGSRWQAPPERVRPAIPGSGVFQSGRRGTGWSLFVAVEGRAVARDIFLDGNTFEDGPSVDREPLVADANAGFSVIIGRIRFAYTVNWRSKAFDGQDDPHVFGAVSVGRRIGAGRE